MEKEVKDKRQIILIRRRPDKQKEDNTMDNGILKKALARGILVGLILALAVLAARVLVAKTDFIATVTSWYGILSLICFPVGCILLFYFDLKKK